jgi:recombinational DNA repair ATPase RecF
MKAYRKVKTKVKKWEQEFQQETGKDVNEHRIEFLQWLDAKGEDTYGLLERQTTEPAHEVKVRVRTVTPPVVQIDMAKLARALEADPRHKSSKNI